MVKIEALGYFPSLQLGWKARVRGSVPSITPAHAKHRRGHQHHTLSTQQLLKKLIWVQFKPPPGNGDGMGASHRGARRSCPRRQGRTRQLRALRTCLWPEPEEERGERKHPENNAGKAAMPPAILGAGRKPGEAGKAKPGNKSGRKRCGFPLLGLGPAPAPRCPAVCLAVPLSPAMCGASPGCPARHRQGEGSSGSPLRTPCGRQGASSSAPRTAGTPIPSSGGAAGAPSPPPFILPPCPLAPRPPLPWLRRGSAPHGGRPAEPSPAPHPRPGRPPCGAWAGLGLTPAPPARGWGQSRFPAPSAPSPLPESTGGAPGPAAVPPALRAPGRAQHPQDGGAELRGLWQPLCHPAAAGNNGLSSGTAALGCHDPCFVAASVPGAERGAAAASGLAQKEGVRVNAPPGGVTPGASSTMASPICSPKQATAAFRVRKCTPRLRSSPRSRLGSFPKFHKSLVVHLIIHKVEILPGKRDPFASESSGKEQGISPSRATPSCGPHFQGTAPNYPVPG